MNHTYAKAIFALPFIVFVVLGVAAKLRIDGIPVAKRRIGVVEVVQLLLNVTGYIWLPLVWLFFKPLAFADYPARPFAIITGAMLYGWGVWLFHRTLRELGKYWSPSLELKEGHRLVTEGVYRRVRHPMYLSAIIIAAGQALAIPNYLAGPAALVSIIMLVAFRVPAEERMMIEEFGDEYEAYRKRTNRLIPGLW